MDQAEEVASAGRAESAARGKKIPGGPLLMDVPERLGIWAVPVSCLALLMPFMTPCAVRPRSLPSAAASPMASLTEEAMLRLRRAPAG